MDLNYKITSVKIVMKWASRYNTVKHMTAAMEKKTVLVLNVILNMLHMQMVSLVMTVKK